MQTVAESIYDHPRYYDLIFGSDWVAEYRFLTEVFDQHVRGKTRRLLEPACGTGRLMFRMLKAGYHCEGLDLNEKAVEFCNARLRRHGFRETAWVGDMCNFIVAKPFDAAFNTINSFRHLLSEDLARAHLRCVAEALRKGGIYVLGLHLTPTEGTPLTEESWSARRGHLGIITRLETFETNLRKRAERCRMTMDVYSPTEQFQLVDELVFRTYTLPQMQKLFGEVPELQVAEVYDFRYRIDQPTELAADTQDVVFILQKQ